MIAVILTIHTLIVLGLIVVVLLQRSDGGALGLGGGGGGGFMTGRGAANALTRTTSILAALFFATSLGLAIAAGSGEEDEAIIEDLTGQSAPETDGIPAAPSTEDLLESLGGDDSEEPAAAAETVDAPMTEEEILDSLGSETAPADAAETEETPEEPEEPNN